MDINFLSSSDYECEFILKNTTSKIANSLRKIILNEIPIFAIDTIVDIKNTSLLLDEQLIQRLTYIPFISPSVDNYVLENECTCDKECDKCSIEFSINVENKTSKPITVYNTDIISPKIKIYTDSKYGIPITKLNPGQHLNVNGFIKKGVGKNHSKWSPVSSATYRYMPDIKTTSNLTLEDKKKLVKICPMGVFSVDIEDLKYDTQKCTMCNECVYNYKDDVVVDYLKDTVIFTIESTGCLVVEKILSDALDIFQLKE